MGKSENRRFGYGHDPTEPAVVEGLMGGSLVLDEADYRPGDTVSGTIDTLLLPSFF